MVSDAVKEQNNPQKLPMSGQRRRYPPKTLTGSGTGKQKHHRKGDHSGAPTVYACAPQKLPGMENESVADKAPKRSFVVRHDEQH
jgi:hypothetical protein